VLVLVSDLFQVLTQLRLQSSWQRRDAIFAAFLTSLQIKILRAQLSAFHQT
jgi:hypothetical protein